LILFSIHALKLLIESIAQKYDLRAKLNKILHIHKNFVQEKYAK